MIQTHLKTLVQRENTRRIRVAVASAESARENWPSHPGPHPNVTSGALETTTTHSLARTLRQSPIARLKSALLAMMGRAEVIQIKKSRTFVDRSCSCSSKSLCSQPWPLRSRRTPWCTQCRTSTLTPSVPLLLHPRSNQPVLCLCRQQHRLRLRLRLRHTSKTRLLHLACAVHIDAVYQSRSKKTKGENLVARRRGSHLFAESILCGILRPFVSKFEIRQTHSRRTRRMKRASFWFGEHLTRKADIDRRLWTLGANF